MDGIVTVATASKVVNLIAFQMKDFVIRRPGVCRGALANSEAFAVLVANALLSVMP